MSAPNHSSVLAGLDARFNLSTHDGAGQYTEAAAWVLSQRDRNWGHIAKSGAQKQYNGHGLDAVMYRITGDVIDLIINAGGPGVASPSWQEKEPTDTSLWRPAFDPGTPDPSPPPPPPPPPLPPPDVKPLESKIVELQSAVARLHALVEHLSAIVQARVDNPPPITIPPITFPVYSGRLGMNLRLTPQK